MFVQPNVHSAECSFGRVFVRPSVRSAEYSFGRVFVRPSVRSAECSFGLVFVRPSVRSDECPSVQIIDQMFVRPGVVMQKTGFFLFRLFLIFNFFSDLLKR